MRLFYALALTFAVTSAVWTPQAQAQSTRISGWIVDRSTDPITDTVTAIAIAPESPQGRRNSLSLTISCVGDAVVVAVTHRALQGDANNRVRFTYRFDDNPPVGPLSVQLRSDRRATLPFLNTPDRDRPFVAAAAQARQIVLRVLDPPSSAAITTTVPLAGFARVVEALGCQ